MVGEHVVRQPECSAIDKDGFVCLGLGEACDKVQGCLDRGPGRAPLSPVPGNAVAHLVVPGFCGGDIAARAARLDDEALSEGRFAGLGSADDKSEVRK